MPEQPARTPYEVVADHLAGVLQGDPVAMAADYSANAILVRDVTHEGQEAIAQYFATVPLRLGDGRVEFGEPRVEDNRVAVAWRLVGGPGDGTSGTDRFQVEDGAIVHQTVTLDGGDF